ncbi:D-cysteine desulfhydrase family protein [Paraglaciecola arctica]|uniref:D-cysteine desulfhydrase family protein n=1 Tax=Paraglaciecola arctica TaxID=1128911 RepID=UPI001C076123|nr:D-cysteine desulfhydrase family protein [Paraglaciecola arctica]MBU3004487.1 D-cysteine desulfhydrase family protein [Paraglaciecola arctica]
MNIKHFEKTSLGFFPTPLVELSNLSHFLDGPQIFMKRDDLTGLALGGNKTRKLEYILADALQQGCNTIITAGAAQSNHCRQTAAAAAKLNLECHLLLGGEAPTETQGNLLLDQLFGSRIHWTGSNRKGQDIPRIFSQLQAEGKKPYIVPYGGSNELGALSFIDAVAELQQQNTGIEFSHVIFASSSGGTHAGLILGKEIYKQTFDLIGINIDKEANSDLPFEQQITQLVNSTAEKIGLNYQFQPQQLMLNADYVGGGYGVIGQQEKEAISLTAKHEGILLDPVYTARAMSGLIHLVRSGKLTKNDKVLFWHTGGAPSLFAYAQELN